MRRRRARGGAMPATLASLAIAVALGALGAAVADARITLYKRGPILGTTPTAIDIEVGTGIAREDRRFGLREPPPVLVVVPLRRAALRPGVAVALVFARTGADDALRSVVVAAPGGTGLTTAWPRTHGDVRVARGRVVRGRIARGRVADLASEAAETTFATGGRPVRLRLGADVAVFALRPGSRGDLGAGRAALVVASQAQDDLFGDALAVVVGAGTAPVPPL